MSLNIPIILRTSTSKTGAYGKLNVGKSVVYFILLFDCISVALLTTYAGRTEVNFLELKRHNVPMATGMGFGQ